MCRTPRLCMQQPRGQDLGGCARRAGLASGVFRGASGTGDLVSPGRSRFRTRFITLWLGDAGVGPKTSNVSLAERGFGHSLLGATPGFIRLSPVLIFLEFIDWCGGEEVKGVGWSRMCAVTVTGCGQQQCWTQTAQPQTAGETEAWGSADSALGPVSVHVT